MQPWRRYLLDFIFYNNMGATKIAVLVVNLIVTLQIHHDNESFAWIVAIISPSTFKQISPF